MVLHTRGRVGSRRFFRQERSLRNDTLVPEGFSVLGVLLFVFQFLWAYLILQLLLKISNRLFLLFFIVTIVYGEV